MIDPTIDKVLTDPAADLDAVLDGVRELSHQEIAALWDSTEKPLAIGSSTDSLRRAAEADGWEVAQVWDQGEREFMLAYDDDSVVLIGHSQTGPIAAVLWSHKQATGQNYAICDGEFLVDGRLAWQRSVSGKPWVLCPDHPIVIQAIDTPVFVGGFPTRSNEPVAIQPGQKATVRLTRMGNASRLAQWDVEI